MVRGKTREYVKEWRKFWKGVILSLWLLHLPDAFLTISSIFLQSAFSVWYFRRNFCIEVSSTSYIIVFPSLSLKLFTSLDKTKSSAASSRSKHFLNDSKTRWLAAFFSASSSRLRQTFPESLARKVAYRLISSFAQFLDLFVLYLIIFIIFFFVESCLLNYS